MFATEEPRFSNAAGIEAIFENVFLTIICQPQSTRLHGKDFFTGQSFYPGLSLFVKESCRINSSPNWVIL